ncbi:DUF4329 domain-containing protein, partial [Acinetobacter baumannii]
MTRDPASDGRNFYLYCNSDPLRFFDPTGLKPGDKYPTRDGAARGAIDDINPWSIALGKEYAGLIYENPDGTFSYTLPARGDQAS